MIGLTPRHLIATVVAVFVACGRVAPPETTSLPVAATATATEFARTASLPPLPPLATPSTAAVSATPFTGSGDWAIVAVAIEARVPAGATTTQILAVPMAGGKPQLVVKYPSDAAGLGSNLCSAPALSPDGSRVAVSYLARGCWIAIVDLRSGRVMGVPTDPTTADRFPSWSPDGTALAYVRSGGAPPRNADNLELWVADQNGSGARLVYAEIGHPDVVGGPRVGRAAWSGDGRTIFLNIAGSDRTLSIDVASGRASDFGRLLTGLGVRAEHPTDAATVASPLGQAVEIFDQPSGAQVLVPASKGSDLTSPRWRPGSNDVMYLREGRLELTRGRSDVRTLDLRATGFAWNADGSSFVYLPSDVGSSVIALRRAAFDGSLNAEVWQMNLGSDQMIRARWVELFQYR